MNFHISQHYCFLYDHCLYLLCITRVVKQCFGNQKDIWTTLSLFQIYHFFGIKDRYEVKSSSTCLLQVSRVSRRLLLKGDRQNTDSVHRLPRWNIQMYYPKMNSPNKILFRMNSIKSTTSHKVTLQAPSLFSSVDAINKWTGLVCMLSLLLAHIKVLVLANAVRKWLSWLEALWSVHFESLLKMFGLVF